MACSTVVAVGFALTSSARVGNPESDGTRGHLPRKKKAAFRGGFGRRVCGSWAGARHHIFVTAGAPCRALWREVFSTWLVTLRSEGETGRVRTLVRSSARSSPWASGPCLPSRAPSFTSLWTTRTSTRQVTLCAKCCHAPAGREFCRIFSNLRAFWQSDRRPAPWHTGSHTRRRFRRNGGVA